MCADCSKNTHNNATAQKNMQVNICSITSRDLSTYNRNKAHRKKENGFMFVIITNGDCCIPKTDYTAVHTTGRAQQSI